MTSFADGDSRDENVFDVLLMSLGDELDGMLQTLLEPIGKAIADSIAGSRVRIAKFEERYGHEAYGREAAHMLAEEEHAVVEHFLGLAFVAAQTAYITAVVSRLTDVHRLARVRNNTALTTTPGSKPDMLQYRFRPAPKKPYSQIEIVDAFANYYKHRDE
jgi:ubiquinone biosynthesis protein UbiJ